MITACKRQGLVHVILKGFPYEDYLGLGCGLSIEKGFVDECFAFEMQSLEDWVEAVTELCLKFIH